jgi:hypothetical protein
MSWKLTKFQLIQHIQTIVIFIFSYLFIVWLSGNLFKVHAILSQTDAESFSFLSGETSFISNKHFFWPFCQYQNEKSFVYRLSFHWRFWFPRKPFDENSSAVYHAKMVPKAYRFILPLRLLSWYSNFFSQETIQWVLTLCPFHLISQGLHTKTLNYFLLSLFLEIFKLFCMF